MAFRDLMENDCLNADLIYVGIPYDKSASVGRGAGKTPDKLRKLSDFLPPYSLSGFDLKGFKIFDAGDFFLKKKEVSYAALSEALLSIYRLEKLNLFVGGDHSISISTERAFINYAKSEGKTPVILHFDAHADICDYYDGSFYSHANPNRRAIDNGLSPNNLVMFGIRSFESQEKEFLGVHPEIKIFDANIINQTDTNLFIDYLNNKYDKKQCLFHISFDIDMIDPSFAPGTGTPEAFGVNAEKALDLLKSIVINFLPISFDLVEVSPPLDNNDITSWLALKILYELFAILKEKKQER